MSTPAAVVRKSWTVHAPDRYLTTRPVEGVATVSVGGTIIARSNNAVWLREGGRDEVLYVPMCDLTGVNVTLSDRSFDCRWKGAARYFNLGVGARQLDNAAWAYPQAPDNLAALRDRVAFDLAQVCVRAEGENLLGGPEALLA